MNAQRGIRSLTNRVQRHQFHRLVIIVPDVPSDECEHVSVCPTRPVSGRAALTPLSESSVTVDLDVVPAGEAAFLVEMVKERGMNGGELL